MVIILSKLISLAVIGGGYAKVYPGGLSKIFCRASALDSYEIKILLNQL